MNLSALLTKIGATNDKQTIRRTADMKYAIKIIRIIEHPDPIEPNRSSVVYEQTFDEMDLVKTVAAINESVAALNKEGE